MAVKLSEKQKEVGKEGIGRKELYTKCIKCGMFSKVTTHKMSYWVKHCFSCGELMRCN